MQMLRAHQVCFTLGQSALRQRRTAFRQNLTYNKAENRVSEEFQLFIVGQDVSGCGSGFFKAARFVVNGADEKLTIPNLLVETVFHSLQFPTPRFTPPCYF